MWHYECCAVRISRHNLAVRQSFNEVIWLSLCYVHSDDNPRGSSYWRKSTGPFQDQNIVEFGNYMAGVENPIVSSFSAWPVCKQ